MNFWTHLMWDASSRGAILHFAMTHLIYIEQECNIIPSTAVSRMLSETLANLSKRLRFFSSSIANISLIFLVAPKIWPSISVNVRASVLSFFAWIRKSLHSWKRVIQWFFLVVYLLKSVTDWQTVWQMDTPEWLHQTRFDATFSLHAERKPWLCPGCFPPNILFFFAMYWPLHRRCIQNLCSRHILYYR